MQIISSRSRRSRKPGRVSIIKPDGVPRSLEHTLSVGKELLQHGSEDLRDDVVGLTWKAAVLPLGEGVHQRLCSVAQKRRAVPTVHHERGDRDGVHEFGRHRHITQNSHFVDEGVRHVLKRRPEGSMSQLGNDFDGYAHPLRLEELNRLTSATRQNQIRDLCCQILRWSRPTVVDNQWWLVLHPLTD